jgi:hypothetical protein
MKTSFHILEPQVNKLYEKEFDSNDIESINNHCESIAQFIESCGWNVEDYIRAMFRDELLNFCNESVVIN